MLHVVKVTPIYVYSAERGGRLRTRRTVAYRAVCSCAWRSPARSTVAAVRELAADHRRGGG
jgi:hypothetical protein